MTMKLRLTGRDSFNGPIIGHINVMRDQVILVRDAEGTYLRTLVNKDVSPTSLSSPC